MNETYFFYLKFKIFLTHGCLNTFFKIANEMKI
jgi:hypothetical protein